MWDLHNNVVITRCLGPVAKATTAATVGVAVDRAGYEAVELSFSYGSITATNATLTPVVLESDSATAASFTSVADADLIGTEANAGIAAGTRTSGTTKFVTKRVGYKGNKRYVKGTIASTVTAATIVGCNVLLGKPRHAAQ